MRQQFFENTRHTRYESLLKMNAMSLTYSIRKFTLDVSQVPIITHKQITGCENFLSKANINFFLNAWLQQCLETL